MDGRGSRPNGLERFFDGVTPDCVRYVGDGSWWRRLPNGVNKNPDFKVTGQNKVIELFGDYWHRSDNPFVLIELFHRIGVECLVVWENDLRRDPSGVVSLVEQFVGAEGGE